MVVVIVVVVVVGVGWVGWIGGWVVCGKGPICMQFLKQLTRCMCAAGGKRAPDRQTSRQAGWCDGAMAGGGGGGGGGAGAVLLCCGVVWYSKQARKQESKTNKQNISARLRVPHNENAAMRRALVAG